MKQLNKKNKFVFENIGGSFQFHSRHAEDLLRILQLDSTVWAALCVPVASLNGDPAFFQALDGDGNGMIRVDEVRSAITWLNDVLTEINVLNSQEATLPLTALNCDSQDGRIMAEFAAAHAEELLNENQQLELSKIRGKLKQVLSGPLTGDGIMKLSAIADSPAKELYLAITGLLKTPDHMTADDLEKFVSNAESFIEWAKTTEKPLFRNQDPVLYHDAYKAMADKIDEYFRFCELIQIDPAHAGRFQLNPAQLPELDLQNSEQLNAVLQQAPLAIPSADAVLDLKQTINPFYQKKAENFARLFELETLNEEQWQQLKNDFAAYEEYLSKARGDLVGQLGKDKLSELLKSNQVTLLRQRFAEDKSLSSVVDALRKLERLLLYRRYMLDFANNFVSFEAFFNPSRISMLQAGRLIMDGKSYTLAVWINDVASHKKIAVRSHLCLLYLDVVSSGKNAVNRKLAVAVTGGSLSRIYVGKPAFFIDNDNITYNGKIVDMVEGPISFGQTLFAPFRRMSEAVSSKLQKLTDFSSTEKTLTQAIDQGKMPVVTPAAPTQSPAQRFLGNGSVMLLAGGLSVAALGAGLSFVLKSITNAITAISALPAYVILIWIAVLLAIFLVPTAIFAFLKLRKRNLTLFLEAGGWAVNLPMRLNMQVSGIFTHTAEYPTGSIFKLITRPKPRRSIIFILLITIVLAAATAALWYLQK